MNNWNHTRDMGDLMVTKISYHRNGIMGTPFHIVLFKQKYEEEENNLVGIVFPENHNIAILDVNLLYNDVIEFGENSWRGDNYEPYLREEIALYEQNR